MWDLGLVFKGSVCAPMLLDECLLWNNSINPCALTVTLALDNSQECLCLLCDPSSEFIVGLPSPFTCHDDQEHR